MNKCFKTNSYTSSILHVCRTLYVKKSLRIKNLQIKDILQSEFPFETWVLFLKS